MTVRIDAATLIIALICLEGVRPSLGFVLTTSFSQRPWLAPSTPTPTQLMPRPPPPSTTVLFMGLRGKKIRRERRRARKEPTPPRIATPYGPVRMPKPPRVCSACVGRGIVRCNVCEGRSVIRATGQRRNNQIGPPERLPGSLWTAVTTREGHRHYKIKETRGSKKKENLEALMANCCGNPITFWVPAEELKDKTSWRKGWVTLEDIRQADGGALYDIALCFRCKGSRILECVECGGQGEIESFEPIYND